MEEIINNLDQRGCMVLTVLLGKRMYELLKNEKNELTDTKDSKDAKAILNNIVLPSRIIYA